MSGPKLSEAELARLRAERLERERQELLRRLKEGQKLHRETCDNIKAFIARANQQFGQVDKAYQSLMKAKFDQMMAMVAEVPVADKKEPQSYHDAVNQMKDAMSMASGQLDDIFQKTMHRATVDKDLTDAGHLYQAFQTMVDSTDDEVQVLKLDFACNYDQQYLRQQLQDLFNHLKNLKGTNVQGLQPFAKKHGVQLNRFLQEDGLWDNRSKVRTYMQQVLNEEQEIIRLWKERKALYDTYLALAVTLDITPKNPQDFDGAAQLREEIEKLEQQYRKKDEMDYIADQINSVMVDLGYQFVASRVLTRQDDKETDFSLYKVDDQTGVAVFTDQSGGVMMRMTVLGDDPTITEDDRDFSYQRQIDFCSGHPDIVDALAEKGIYLKQKNYQQPDKKHTYKLQVTKKNQDKDVSKQKLDRRRRRRAGTKKMRAM